MKSIIELQRMLDSNRALEKIYTERLKASENNHKLAYENGDRDSMDFFAQDISEIRAQLSILKVTEVRLKAKIAQAERTENASK